MLRPVRNPQIRPREIRSIQIERNGERLAETSGAAAEVAIWDLRTSASAHEVEPMRRLHRSDQHRGCLTGRLGHDVQTHMHAIDEVDVRLSRWPEHAPIAQG